MKIVKTALLISWFSLSSFSFIEPDEWKDFNQALVTAQKEKKYILIDFYTDWCGWCKKMDSNTYGDQEVMKLLRSKFVAVKLNAEDNSKTVTIDGKTMTNSELTRYFGINGFPTTVFLDPEGNPITKVPGYIEKDKMIQILNYFSSGSYKQRTFVDFVASTK